MTKLDISTASNASAFCYQRAIVYIFRPVDLSGHKVGQVTTHAQWLWRLANCLIAIASTAHIWIYKAAFL